MTITNTAMTASQPPTIHHMTLARLLASGVQSRFAGPVRRWLRLLSVTHASTGRRG